MKLGEFLSAGNQQPAPVKPVKFRIIGKNLDGIQLISDAEAVLTFIDEHTRQEAIKDAQKECAALYGKEPIPAERIDDQVTYHFLTKSLRTTEDYRVQFATNANELRRALTLRVAGDLMTAYREFVAEEFPDFIDQEEFDKLVKEAESKSLAVLLSEFGFSKIYRAFPSLAAQFGK